MNSFSQNSKTEKQTITKNDKPGLHITEDLLLVHDPSAGEGKTRGMDKGLFLCFKGRLCAGGSAGLGLPVWKTGNNTFFPALVSIEKTSEETIEMVMSMERVLTWELAGGAVMPKSFAVFLERLTAMYMTNENFQRRMLVVREIVFSLFRVRSQMTTVSGRGICRVSYKAGPESLYIKADGSGLRGPGKLIMLNEVEGRPFTRLTDGKKVWEGPEIPGWVAAGRGVCFQSPLLGLEVSISRETKGTAWDAELFCGREVAKDLNWAGIAVMARAGVTDYRVDIRKWKS